MIGYMSISDEVSSDDNAEGVVSLHALQRDVDMIIRLAAVVGSIYIISESVVWSLLRLSLIHI